MATETGIIEQIISPTTGKIKRDPSGVFPNPVEYDDATLITRNITLLAGSKVTYDIDLDAMVTNIRLSIPAVDPNFPPDEPGQILINTDLTGNLEIKTGQIYTVRGATISGSVTMKGGKLILSSTQDGSRRGIIKETIEGKDNMRVVIYQSDVEGIVDLKDGLEVTVYDGVLNKVEIKRSQEVSIKKSKIKHDLDVKENMRISISDTTVTGDVELKKNTTASITNSTIGGDLTLKDNTNCTSTNNKVTGENLGCR